MKLGFVIPVYKHGSTLESVVKKILPFDCPIIVVDDGNDEVNKKFIKENAEKYNQIHVVTRLKNGGKGSAMKDGVLEADKLGLTHVFQIDSDGQHDASRVNYFIEVAKENPNCIICGYPEYDLNAPKQRVNSRKFSNMWIHIVTLSSEIKDSMIGFRVYPVKPFVKVIKRNIFINNRMGFDIDILVHMSWKGVHIVSQSVKVFYPEDGISNYRFFRDTLGISTTYARLCIGMIIRLPVLLFRKCFKRNK